MILREEIREALQANDALNEHPNMADLLAVASCETHISSGGFPYLCESGFQRFIDRIPHLFNHGQAILSWLSVLSAVVKASAVNEVEAASLKRAQKVMATVVRTASITAPSDLWLLRQVLSTHRELGVLDALLNDGEIRVEALATKKSLHGRQLKIDLHFLASRGYLECYGDAFTPSSDPGVRQILAGAEVLNPVWKTDMVSQWVSWFKGEDVDKALEAAMLEPAPGDNSVRPARAWVATAEELELGFRLVPLVLALRALSISFELKRKVIWGDHVPRQHPALEALLQRAGILVEGRVTALGARVFERGPGPFGIIGAYYPYLNQLDGLLQGELNKSWVNRGKNVAASQDANRKTFQKANDALDRFCKDTAFDYRIFIEHAVGRGEATRQRFNQDGESRIAYFGADLEDAAIEQAMAEKAEGRLPSNMRFVRNADIGDPQKIIDALTQAALPTQGAVMVVGNGFHEIRDQTNRKMLQVLKGYQEAGILLIFTEETGLSDEDLLATAWNTYHAGFRYVHEMSGQGLRPSWDRARMRKVWSWRKCARRAGYTVLDAYTSATRTIFPTRKPHRRNPSISVTYFCVPEIVMERLGLEA